MLADKVQGAAAQLQTYASDGGGSKGGDGVDEAVRRRVLPRLRELASAVQEEVVGEVMERQQTSLVEMEVRDARGAQCVRVKGVGGVTPRGTSLVLPPRPHPARTAPAPPR